MGHTEIFVFGAINSFLKCSFSFFFYYIFLDNDILEYTTFLSHLPLPVLLALPAPTSPPFSSWQVPFHFMSFCFVTLILIWAIPVAVGMKLPIDV